MTIQFILITPTLRFCFLMKDLGISMCYCASVWFFNPSSSSGVEKENWSWKSNIVLVLSPGGDISDRGESFLLTDLHLYVHGPPRSFSWRWHGSLWVVYMCIRCGWRKEAGQGHLEVQSHSGSVIHTIAPHTQRLLDLLIWIKWRCCSLFVGKKNKLRANFQRSHFFFFMKCI